MPVGVEQLERAQGCDLLHVLIMSGTWARIVACGLTDTAAAATISVDFDAETLWSGTFNLKTPSPMSRGDYDVRAALPRIHTLLDRHDIPATFMVPAAGRR